MGRLFSNRQEPLSEAGRIELAREVERGRLAADFLRSRFWIAYAEQFFKDEEQRAYAGACWEPGKSSAPQDIAMQNALNSGMRLQLKRIEAEFRSWETQAVSAREKLAKDDRLKAEREVVS